MVVAKRYGGLSEVSRRSYGGVSEVYVPGSVEEEVKIIVKNNVFCHRYEKSS